MHTFHIRRPDENLAIGFRQRQLFQLLAGNLDGYPRFGLTVCIALIEIGPQSGFDQVENAAQGTVVIEAGHSIEQAAQGFAGRFDRLLTLCLIIKRGRVEFHPRQLKQATGDLGIGSERLLLNRLGRIETGLLAVARAGPQEGGLAIVDANLDNEAVEAIILGPPLGDSEQGFLHHRSDFSQVTPTDGV